MNDISFTTVHTLASVTFSQEKKTSSKELFGKSILLTYGHVNKDKNLMLLQEM